MGFCPVFFILLLVIIAINNKLIFILIVKKKPGRKSMSKWLNSKRFITLTLSKMFNEHIFYIKKGRTTHESKNSHYYWCRTSRFDGRA
jgi:hypothetical protein